MEGPIAVVGGSGKLAGCCIRKLLSDNRNVIAVGRDVSKMQDMYGSFPSLSFATGDVSQPEALKEALRGVSGVINASSGKTYFSADSVDHLGAGAVAEAANAAGAKHIVHVTSCLVTSKHRFHPMRVMLNNVRYGLMDAKLKGETLVRQSGMPYTIVRPGGLTEEAGGHSELIISQGDQGSPGRVCREDVAVVCIAALDNSSESNRRTIELSAKPSDKQYTTAGLFTGTTADHEEATT